MPPPTLRSSSLMRVLRLPYVFSNNIDQCRDGEVLKHRRKRIINSNSKSRNSKAVVASATMNKDSISTNNDSSIQHRRTKESAGLVWKSCKCPTSTSATDIQVVGDKRATQVGIIGQALEEGVQQRYCRSLSTTSQQQHTKDGSLRKT